MAGRIVTMVFWLHRWLGAVLGVLMLLWCLSGIVMIYVPYPQYSDRGAGDSYRPAALVPIRLGTIRLPEDVEADASAQSATIEMLAAKPVLHLSTRGGDALYNLDTGARIDSVDANTALAVARSYVVQRGLRANAPLAESLVHDQWTVSGEFDADRPLWHVLLGDEAGTELYVSHASGRVVQKTARAQRFWNWLGAVPHWLYFTRLRQDVGLWFNVVIYASLAGSFLVLLGLYIGLRQLLQARRTGRYSPYDGFLWWHHLPALVFGLFTLTWVASGLLSMNPWGLLEGEGGGAAQQQLAGRPQAWREVRRSLLAMQPRLPAGTVMATMNAFDGRIYWIAQAADGARMRFDADGQPRPVAPADAQRGAALLDAPSANYLRSEDNYYYAGPDGGQSRWPVWRIISKGEPQTRYYIDNTSGELLAALDPAARSYRWLHLGLHRLDFTGALRARPLRDVVLLLLMAGVTMVCATGAWLGIFRLIGRPRRQPVHRPAKSPDRR